MEYGFSSFHILTLSISHRCFLQLSSAFQLLKFLTSCNMTNVSCVIGAIVIASPRTYYLYCAIICDGVSPKSNMELISFLFFTINDVFNALQNPTTSIPWHWSPSLFVCSLHLYIRWQRLLSIYGCLAIKWHWHLHLLDVPYANLPIFFVFCLVFWCCDIAS